MTWLRPTLRKYELNASYAFVRNDPVDKIDILGLTVYLEAHPVALGMNHSKITLIVCSGSKFFNDYRFRHTTQDGQHYATIGASPDSAWISPEIW